MRAGHRMVIQAILSKVELHQPNLSGNTHEHNCLRGTPDPRFNIFQDAKIASGTSADAPGKILGS